MKWLKRLLLFVVFLIVFAGALGLGGYWLSRGTPDWYTPRHTDPQQLAAAAHRAEQEMARTLNWANEQAHRPPSQASTSRPAEAFQISLTEDELNGFLQKWDATFGWRDHYDKFVSDPQIVLQDGQLIVAGVVKQTGTVLSIALEPRISDGKLAMPIAQVLAGRLRVPQSFWEGYRQTLEKSVASHLPEWQQGAAIARDGTANTDAVAAGMSELLLNVLNNQPAWPVMFLPSGVHNGRKSLPVRLTDVKLAGKSMTLTVEPMTVPERQALLQQIRTSDPLLADTSDAQAPARD